MKSPSAEGSALLAEGDEKTLHASESIRVPVDEPPHTALFLTNPRSSLKGQKKNPPRI
jgi:hypothetical protein